ncbi:MAG: regulatory protein GemA [Rhodospirillaceae bacterium]|nr:regulatory protein GemA [Rhodospirillaceae bacterium]
MTTTPARRKLYAALHFAATKAGLDDAAYRDMLAARTGQTSAKDLTECEIWAVLDHLNGGTHFPRATRPLARKVHALWRAGAEAGWVRTGTREALRAFCGRVLYPGQHVVTADPDLLPDSDLTKVVEALKAMDRRVQGKGAQ